jgi:hypothetical protein
MDRMSATMTGARWPGARLSGAAVFRLATKPWVRYAPCAPIRGAETRLRAELLGDAPPEQRYRSVFMYFAQGFLHHLAGSSRVQYCGAGSFNSHAISGLEVFARTAPLLAAWMYSGPGEVIQDSLDGRPIDLIALLKTGILFTCRRRVPHDLTL